jgi:hypothetical protein
MNQLSSNPSPTHAVLTWNCHLAAAVDAEHVLQDDVGDEEAAEVVANLGTILY